MSRRHEGCVFELMLLLVAVAAMWPLVAWGMIVTSRPWEEVIDMPMRPSRFARREVVPPSPD